MCAVEGHGALRKERKRNEQKQKQPRPNRSRMAVDNPPGRTLHDERF